MRIRNSVFTVALLLTSLVCLSAQKSNEIRLKGNVVDEENGSPIPYVNIAVKETSYGAASNLEGRFEIILGNPSYADYWLSFSCIGYHTFEVRIAELRTQKEVVIKLRPQILELPDVAIFSTELTDYDILKKAVENNTNFRPGKNYYQTPAISILAYKYVDEIWFKKMAIGILSDLLS